MNEDDEYMSIRDSNEMIKYSGYIDLNAPRVHRARIRARLDSLAPTKLYEKLWDKKWNAVRRIECICIVFHTIRWRDILFFSFLLGIGLSLHVSLKRSELPHNVFVFSSSIPFLRASTSNRKGMRRWWQSAKVRTNDPIHVEFYDLSFTFALFSAALNFLIFPLSVECTHIDCGIFGGVQT